MDDSDDEYDPLGSSVGDTELEKVREGGWWEGGRGRKLREGEVTREGEGREEGRVVGREGGRGRGEREGEGRERKGGW